MAVCPYNVFTVQALADSDKSQLSLMGKFKLWVHGGKQAYAIRAEDCHACGLCVNACPENAIGLERQ